MPSRAISTRSPGLAPPVERRRFSIPRLAVYWLALLILTWCGAGALLWLIYAHPVVGGIASGIVALAALLIYLDERAAWK